MKTLIMGLIIGGLLVIGTMGIAAEHEKASQGAGVDALIQESPALVAEGDYKQVLDLIVALPQEERNNIQIRTIECFANLKGWVSDKDPVLKMDWWGLRIKLMYVGDTEATPLLVIFLKDPNPYVRKYAAELSGYIGDKRALDVLSAVKENDDNSGVRKYATWAYQQISDGLTPVTSNLPPLGPGVARTLRAGTDATLRRPQATQEASKAEATSRLPPIPGSVAGAETATPGWPLPDAKPTGARAHHATVILRFRHGGRPRSLARPFCSTCIRILAARQL